MSKKEKPNGKKRGLDPDKDSPAAKATRAFKESLRHHRVVDEKEQREDEARVYAAFKERTEKYGESELQEGLFGLLAEEISFDETNGWISVEMRDFTDPARDNGETLNYAFPYSQVAGFCSARDDGCSCFVIIFKHLPPIMLDMWNLEQANCAVEDLRQIIEEIAGREE